MATSVTTRSFTCPPLPPRVINGLGLLAEARNYAADLSRDVWDFAVEISALRGLGMNNNDFRWLLGRGCIEHAVETGRPSEQGRQFKRAADSPFGEQTCFVLTNVGLTLTLQLDGQPSEAPVGGLSAPVRQTRPETNVMDGPQWNFQLREFRFAGRVIKVFRLPSPNQQTILSAFEEEGWPVRIDDPLPQDPTICAKRRLHDTIKSLNRKQRDRLVRFSGDGTGRGICWEPILENCQSLKLHAGDKQRA